MIPFGENNITKINNLTAADWKPLLDLIPEIETSEKYGDWAKNRLDEGIIDMYPCTKSNIVFKFQKIVYDIPIVIDFDWGHWDDGKKMLRDPEFDFDTVDIPTKCKIITAFVRNDRFCEGALVSAFESGVILKVLKSIERQL